MWRNHVNSIAMSVPLYDLVYRSVNDAYERLHNLTTQMAASGSYVGAEKRRRALQHYVRQTRHQLIQLLVAVRYSKQAAVVTIQPKATTAGAPAMAMSEAAWVSATRVPRQPLRTMFPRSRNTSRIANSSCCLSRAVRSLRWPVPF